MWKLSFIYLFILVHSFFRHGFCEALGKPCLDKCYTNKVIIIIVIIIIIIIIVIIIIIIIAGTFKHSTQSNKYTQNRIKITRSVY